MTYCSAAQSCYRCYTGQWQGNTEIESQGLKLL